MVTDYTTALDGAQVDGIPEATDDVGNASVMYGRLERKGSHLSQGLYMKHLLKHLTTPNLTISEIFARLYSSFTQGKLISIAKIIYLILVY